MQTDRKTALITGSGQNIGRGIAHHLAAAGFNIIINGSSNRDAAESVADEVRAHGVTVLVVMGNVGNKTEAETVAKTGIAHFGAIDVLVNNAAIRPHAAFLETSD
jgi:3-oxoacyl-[acyl-carrier protein] reductase